jgi:hypothetical protein
LRQIEIDNEDLTDSDSGEERRKQKRICSDDRKRARATLLLLRDINKKVSRASGFKLRAPFRSDLSSPCILTFTG